MENNQMLNNGEKKSICAKKNTTYIVTPQEIKTKLIDILDEYGINEVEVDTATLDELDSIHFMEIIVKIEELFDISFPDDYLNIELLASMDNLADIINTELEKKYEAEENETI